MDRNNKYSEWENDFADFLATEEVSVPPELSRNISLRVSNDLNINPWKVFIKIIIIVFTAGSFSLLLCPQLGVGSRHSPLMELFMVFGPAGCRMACGAFFTIVSLGVSCAILKPEELSVLMKTKFLFVSAVCAIGIAVFMCTSPDLILTAALTWAIGAFIGGIISLEAGYKIRLLVSST